MACFLLPHHIPDPRALSVPCLRQTWESSGDGDNLWSQGPYLQPSIFFEMTLSKLLRVAPQNWSLVKLESHIRSQPAKGPAGLSGRPEGPSCPFCFTGDASPSFSRCLPVRETLGGLCTVPFLLAGRFPPNAHHLVILPNVPNVWSYSAICLSTRFPGPHLPVLHPISCFGISLFISDPSGVDSCSSDI